MKDDMQQGLDGIGQDIAALFDAAAHVESTLDVMSDEDVTRLLTARAGRVVSPLTGRVWGVLVVHPLVWRRLGEPDGAGVRIDDKRRVRIVRGEWDQVALVVETGC